MEPMVRSNKPRTSTSRQLIICRKHSKHQQSPGVCSICLNEKLSKLSSSSRATRSRTRTAVVDSSTSSSSLSSSSSGSSCSSPAHNRLHYAMADRRGFTTTFFKSAKNGNDGVLTKSRSVAVITRRRDGGNDVDGGEDRGRKKGGFWSKLLHPRSHKRNVDADHSRTLKQMMEAHVD